MSHIKKNLDFCLCENKGADQLYSNCTVDHCLCFRYTDSTIPLVPISNISSVTVQADLCPNWSETVKIIFSRRCSYVKRPIQKCY